MSEQSLGKYSNKIVVKKDFKNIDASGQSIIKSAFWESNFTNCNFTGCNLTETSFRDCVMQCARFEGVHFDFTLFQNINLAGVEFHNVDFKQPRDIYFIEFDRCNFAGAIFKGCTFEGSEKPFSNSDINHIMLLECDCTSIRFKNTNLSYAKLQGTNFRRSTFYYANLTGADLSGADLSDAVFSQSDFTGAILTGVNISSVNLDGCTGLTQAQVDTMIGNSQTYLPEGLIRPDSWPEYVNDLDFSEES